ncbi:mersacidin/lichenicidin family type 2 lantibiotic [Micromonospora sp. WMMA1949]|uniref:mersacidin/lichenicidin family type 2 lantibiotic n=1 Tax=unclassified Micromonospora TaxID=2617518 RepID=UPI0022B5E81D|nr:MULTISPECIES: mersacidin/lichenicidin family type 2 lantibiotic [unclassified Micromonospora]MCZ7429959.1 mersacidin/lichenicidin family type 2 lantibiotic [Micromonospora sp. WMMA1949]WBC08796.1 mersacidin/lichenicidin family type 2 lantibiotic [Micromonospora sp. WMMA1947]
MDYIRAWKDPVYRASLSDEERAALPANPAGFVELSDHELDTAPGGTWTPTPTITAVTGVAGCFSINGTVCNGTCAVFTVGCCG